MLVGVRSWHELNGVMFVAMRSQCELVDGGGIVILTYRGRSVSLLKSLQSPVLTTSIDIYLTSIDIYLTSIDIYFTSQCRGKRNERIENLPDLIHIKARLKAQSH